MSIQYREQKEYSPADLQSLFSSVNWESAEFPEKLAKAMKNSSVVISAWDGDRLVGLIRSLDDDTAVAFIHYFLVRPEYQKYHIGSELMKRLLEKYTDYLYVKVMPSDPDTIHFYERFGFTQYDNYSAMEIKCGALKELSAEH